MQLEYVMWDDWWIIAKDETGQMYYISTEFWPEWSDYPKTAQAEPNSVEKYMLPIAKAKKGQIGLEKVRGEPQAGADITTLQLDPDTNKAGIINGH